MCIRDRYKCNRLAFGSSQRSVTPAATSTSNQLHGHASGVCKNAISSVQKNAPDGLVVAQCIGPQFESPAEINALERLGAHVVGMTLGPESRLLSETSIPYAGLPCCSNWAAGRTPGMPNEKISHHDVDEIASGMRETGALCSNPLLSDMG